MSERKILYIIGVMLLVSSLLMFVANNVPILASFRFLWAPFLLIYSFFYYTYIFQNKQVFNSLLYGFLYAGILQYTLWVYANDWYKHAILEDFYTLIVSIVFYSILQQKKFFYEWAKLAKVGVLFFFITGIMTIVATQIDPMVVRISYTSSTTQQQLHYNYALEKLGFGSYGFMTALVALFPILVFFIKKGHKIWLSKRSWILLTIFFYYVLIRAQIFANVLVASLILFISFSGSKRFKRSVIISLFVFLVLIIIPTNFWISLLRDTSKYFNPNSEIYYKLNDMAIFLSNPNIYTPVTGAGGRAERYPLLLQAFLSQPFWGDASYSTPYSYAMDVGGHLYWMSRLTLWGIFGFGAYLIILRNIFKPVLRIFNEEFRFYYLLSLLSVIILGFMKALGGREPYIMLLIIIPGLYYLSLQAEKNT